MKINIVVIVLAINIVAAVYAVKYEEKPRRSKSMGAQAVARTLRHYGRHGMTREFGRTVSKVGQKISRLEAAIEQTLERHDKLVRDNANLLESNAVLMETNIALNVDNQCLRASNTELASKYATLLGIMRSLCPITQIDAFSDGSAIFTTTGTVTRTEVAKTTVTTTTTSCRVQPLPLQ